MSVPDRSSYTAPALEKGLEIIESLSRNATPMTLQQLSQSIERSSSEIYRMVEVLVERGYVLREGGLHRLSLKLFDLGIGQMPSSDLVSVAVPAMHEVAQRTRQSVHLCVHDNQRLVVVASVPTPEPLGFSVKLGSHFPFRADRTSVRVLAAFQPDALRELFLDEMMALAVPPRLSRTALRRRLDELRRQGFEENESDTVRGIVDMAYPLFDQFHPGAIASLNMPYLTQRDARMTRLQARKVLAQAARDISQRLGAAQS
jgi:DNA-binding IclR family transcriptional regulator